MDRADQGVVEDPRTNLLGLAVATMPNADVLRERFTGRFLIELPGDALTAMQHLAEAVDRRRQWEEELEAAVRPELEAEIRARLDAGERERLEAGIQELVRERDQDRFEAMVARRLDTALAELLGREMAERLTPAVVARLEQEFGVRPGTRMLSVIVADALVSAAHRNPSAVGLAGLAPDDDVGPLTNLARALVNSRRIEADALDTGSRVDLLINGLRAAASAPSASRAWRRFVANGGSRAMGLSQAEESLPYCSASSGASAAGEPATEIFTSFESDLDVGSFASYVDPRHWPTCSMYFREIRPADNYAAFPTDKWVAPFWEIVDLLPIWTLVTPLEFSYLRNDTEISVYYHLVVPTDWITVDEGFVRVRANPQKRPGARPTILESKKVIRFVDPWLQDLTCLPCLTFWGELAKDMALRCHG
jgi:hypothetical protein